MTPIDTHWPPEMLAEAPPVPLRPVPPATPRREPKRKLSRVERYAAQLAATVEAACAPSTAKPPAVRPAAAAVASAERVEGGCVVYRLPSRWAGR